MHTQSALWAIELPDGRRVEVFGSFFPGREHFASGTGVGFAVRDVPATVQELRDAGIELPGARDQPDSISG